MSRRFGDDFEIEVQARFWSWSLYRILLMTLGLVEMLINVWLKFWRWNLIKICVRTCDMNSTLGAVVPLTMFCFKCFKICLDAPTYSIFEWLRGSSWKKKKGNILRKIFASINHYYQPHDMNTADRRPLPLQKNVVQNSFSFTLCMEKCRFQGGCISVEVF